MSSETIKNETFDEEIMSNDVEDQNLLVPDLDPVNNALKISKHFISLLEDYRYLLTCFFNTCSCHANFDYQFFLKKIEERYTKLSNLVSSNEQVSTILNENDETTLEQLIQINAAQNQQMNCDKFINRVKICERPKLIKSTNDHETQIEENEENGQDDHDQFFDLPKYDISMKGAKIAYKCSFSKCDFISFNQDDLIEHLKCHNGSSMLKSLDLEKREILYVCDQCGKEFAGQKWLENHVENVHAYTKLFTCDYPGCSYQSKFRCVMEDHRRRHAKTKEFKCTWENCDSEFVTRRDMIAHVNFYHKGIKNYFCHWPNCEASFKDSNRLKHHYYTHTGERPYKCDHPGCEASFKQAPHLHKHRRIHGIIRYPQRLLQSPQSLFNCPEAGCPKQFRTSEEFEEHIKNGHIRVKIEDDICFRCIMDNCAEIFSSRDDLSTHLNEKHSFVLNKSIPLETI